MDLRHRLLRHTWLQAALVLAIAVAANHLASVAFLRIDLTADQRYTLAPASIRAVSGLERPLIARVYFTPGLEAPYANHATSVRQLLEELRAWSGGKLQVDVIDPTDPSRAEEAERFGIEPIQYRFRNSQRAEVRAVYMGVSLVYGDKQQVVNPIASLDALEYELVRAIGSLTRADDAQKTLGWLIGDGEPDPARFDDENPIGKLRTALSKRYTVKTLALGADGAVPEDIDALLVIGPQQAVPERTQYQLDQFLMRGGRLALFLSGNKPDFNTLRLSEVRHDLYPWLGHLGVRINRDLVIDRLHNEQLPMPVIVKGQRQSVNVAHPLVPVTDEENEASTIVRGLDRLTLPFISTAELVEPLPPGVEATWLVKTEADAGAAQGLRTVRPDAYKERIEGEKPGPHTVAWALSGRFASFWTGRDIPKPPVAADGSVLEDDPRSRVDEGNDSRIIVVGSADFVANNIAFVENAVDWLLDDASLLAIRTRADSTRRLETLTPERAFGWKLGVVGAPALALVFGAGIAWLRARRQT